MSNLTPLRRSDFPADFYWGTSSSSYQIEGAVKEDGRHPSIWDTFSHTPGKTKNGDTGDIACDHYHRWREDIDLMQSLNVNAYRFSVAWPRVLPEGRGKVNNRGLDFYDKLVDLLLEKGLSPHVTLYHWDLPQVLQDRGGWTSRDTAFAFAEYSEIVAKRLGDRIQTWGTINEPFCAAFVAHLYGTHAPGWTNSETALITSHHILLAHGLSVNAVRAILPHAEIGLVNNPAPTHPASNSPKDQEAARRMDALRNSWFLDPIYGRGYPSLVLKGLGTPNFEKAIQPGDMATISTPTDFCGVNYYNRVVFAHSPGDGWAEAVVVRPPGEYTALNWEVKPDCLRELLVSIHKEYAPKKIYVTENGASYKDKIEDGKINDEGRRRYIETHIAACRDAIAEGVPLGGYFVWTLVDNFEWAYGYTQHFGLASMETLGGNRRLKASGEWYRGFLANRGNKL